MDPCDPLDAQGVVVRYAELLERDISEQRHPARVDSLPFAKSTIKTAIGTSVRYLARSGQLTHELREYLETAYTSLADYLEGELVDLVDEYRRSSDALGSEAHTVADRTKSAAWQTLSQCSLLAGQVARATAEEARTLRQEFRTLVESA
jgi:hypothetical protein